MLKKIKQNLYKHKYHILAGVSICFAGYAFYQYAKDQHRIKLSAFIQALQKNQIDDVIIKGETLYFKSQLSDWYYTSIGRYPLYDLFAKLNKSQSLSYSCENQGHSIMSILTLLATTGITYAMLKSFMPKQLGQNKKSPQIVHGNQTFDAFYGSQNLKVKLKQLIQFLKNKDKFQKLGGRIRKGILFYGPPGTGKTMLAKTLAHESNLPFIQTCASQFEQIFVGVGPKKIRDIFTKAKSCNQGCVIFIDQLDAIGSRGGSMQSSRQTTATINQLLTQLDGFQQNNNIFVIGATNRLDLVDHALIRAGRFDLKMRIDLPDAKSRLGILKTLLKKKKVPHQITQSIQIQISNISQGFSGADMQTLINQSIYNAVRKGDQLITDSHIIEVYKQISKR